MKIPSRRADGMYLATWLQATQLLRPPMIPVILGQETWSLRCEEKLAPQREPTERDDIGSLIQQGEIVGEKIQLSCFLQKIGNTDAPQNCNGQNDDKLWDFGRCPNLTRPDHIVPSRNCALQNEKESFSVGKKYHWSSHWFLSEITP